MRVLILGSDTFLGEALFDFFLACGRHVIEALPLDACRWKSERQAKKALRRCACDLVVDVRIVGSSLSDIRVADIDVDRTVWLARASHRSGRGYLYLSSTQVFSGSVERLYTEDDYPDSEEPMGELLLHCETAVRDSCEKYLILRLGAVFSHRSTNVVTRYLDQLVRGNTLLLENNLRGSPVEAGDAARVVSALVDQLSTEAGVWGIYHYCSCDATNCYEFGETVLASATQYAELGEATVELRKRDEPPPPVNYVLNCTKIRNTFAIKQMPWRGTIPEVVKNYFQVQVQ